MDIHLTMMQHMSTILLKSSYFSFKGIWYYDESWHLLSTVICSNFYFVPVMSVSGVWRQVDFCSELSVWKDNGKDKGWIFLVIHSDLVSALGGLANADPEVTGSSCILLVIHTTWGTCRYCCPHKWPYVSKHWHSLWSTWEQKFLTIQSYSESIRCLWLPLCLVSAGMDLAHVRPKDRGSWMPHVALLVHQAQPSVRSWEFPLQQCQQSSEYKSVS